VRFVLVDSILELDPGKSIRATKVFPAGEEFFRDHFPGFPVVPGVLLTEVMAQAAGKCLQAAGDRSRWPMLAQIKNANFRSWVRPDELITVSCEIGTRTPQFATAAGSLQVAARTVGSADLLFTFVPSDAFAAGYRDEVLERYLAART
jgi:3-hydroxyacyl-[acyl-carrier-protein] dehydratase